MAQWSTHTHLTCIRHVSYLQSDQAPGHAVQLIVCGLKATVVSVKRLLSEVTLVRIDLHDSECVYVCMCVCRGFCGLHVQNVGVRLEATLVRIELRDSECVCVCVCAEGFVDCTYKMLVHVWKPLLYALSCAIRSVCVCVCVCAEGFVDCTYKMLVHFWESLLYTSSTCAFWRV